jgi:hypothetical protein
MNNDKYLKIIDILADKIYMMDLDNSVLKHANERMEAKIKELEEKLNSTCEEINKEEVA